MQAAPPSVCYLGLGANLGDREKNLTEALKRLARIPGLSVNKISSVYETPPVGVTDQPPFLNMVVELNVSLSPRELLEACQEIERDLGRVRTRRWGPRPVDLDLLLWKDVTLRTADLELPHPRMLERQFVLVPLAEIAPDLVLPEGRTAAQVANEQDPGITLWGQLQDDSLPPGHSG